MDQSSSSSLFHHLQTFSDWWRYATSMFGSAKLSYGQGFTNARDEALFLLQHVLALPCQEPDWIDSFLNAQILPHEKSKLNELIQLRINNHMPLCYLVGEAWLQGVMFKCDRRALIPRSLIAELIPETLDAVLDHEPSTVLDMCCGGGSLAVLLAMRFDSADVYAADLSSDALSLARENVELHRLAHRIRLVETNLFSRILPTQKFDLIVCNPPYVNAKSMRELPPEFLQEPQMALAAGRDGMDLIRRLLREIPQFLSDNGVLILEIGHEFEYFSRAFPELDVEWLATSQGDFGVCAIRKIAILSAKP